jgi:ribbon-helix-helix CopG family protein
MAGSSEGLTLDNAAYLTQIRVFVKTIVTATEGRAGFAGNQLYNALYMAARRTQIYLTGEQRKRLDERRRREHRSLAELVREAVDAYLADRSVDTGAILESTFGALPKLKVPSRDEWDRA